MNNNRQLSEILEILLEDEPLRVWSVIVSIFGDLARGEGEELSGAALSALTLPLGIRAEALRVAIHRLRKDGWITSRRNGRTSYYSLTKSSRDESEQAAIRIYQRERTASEALRLVVTAPGIRLADEVKDSISLSRRIGIIRDGTPCPESWLSARWDATSLPEWAIGELARDPVHSACAALDDRLGRADGKLANSAQLTVLERATLRVVIIHLWRRMVLRHPDLPDTLLPHDWPLKTCRKKVHHILQGLPAPGPKDIEAAIS